MRGRLVIEDKLIQEKTPAFEAWQKLQKSPLSGVAIVDEKGCLKKWLTNRQLEEFMAVQALAAYPQPKSVPPVNNELRC